MVDASEASGDVFHNEAGTLMVDSKFNMGPGGQVFISGKRYVLAPATAQGMGIP
jgi:hypothetical protein